MQLLKQVLTKLCIKPFVCGKPLNGYIYSEDPDEMLHNAAFHEDLHCLLWATRSSDK